MINAQLALFVCTLVIGITCVSPSSSRASHVMIPPVPDPLTNHTGCHMSQSSNVCNPNDSATTETMVRFNQYAIHLASVNLSDCACVGSSTNSTIVDDSDVNMFGLVVESIPANLISSHGRQNGMADYAKAVYDQWQLDRYCNSILIVASRHDRAIYVHSNLDDYASFWLNIPLDQMIFDNMVLFTADDVSYQAQQICHGDSRPSTTAQPSGDSSSSKLSGNPFQNPITIFVIVTVIVAFIGGCCCMIKESNSCGNTSRPGPSYLPFWREDTEVSARTSRLSVTSINSMKTLDSDEQSESTDRFNGVSIASPDSTVIDLNISSLSSTPESDSDSENMDAYAGTYERAYAEEYTRSYAGLYASFYDTSRSESS